MSEVCNEIKSEGEKFNMTLGHAELAFVSNIFFNISKTLVMNDLEKANFLFSYFACLTKVFKLKIDDASIEQMDKIFKQFKKQCEDSEKRGDA